MQKGYSRYRRETIESDRKTLNLLQDSGFSKYEAKILLNDLYQARNFQEINRASANVYYHVNADNFIPTEYAPAEPDYSVESNSIQNWGY